MIARAIKTPVKFDGATTLAAEDVVGVKRHDGATFVHCGAGINFRVDGSKELAERKWKDGLRFGLQLAGDGEAPLAVAVEEVPALLSAIRGQLSDDLGLSYRATWVDAGDTAETPAGAHDTIVLYGLVTVRIGGIEKKLSPGGRVSIEAGGTYSVEADSRALLAFFWKTQAAGG